MTLQDLQQGSHVRRSEPEAQLPTALPALDTTFDYDVAIVGLGYVGLPTALAFHGAGYRVLGLDVSLRRLAVIREQRADLLPADRQRLGQALEDPSFALTSNAADIRRAGAVIIAVPTPVDEFLVPDLGILLSACRTVVDQAVPGQLLLLTSTTYAGSTRELLAAPLAERGLIAGTDVYVAFSPERINPGVADFAQEEVPRVVGGMTEACGERARSLLAKYVPRVHLVPSTEAAEMTKLLENTFRAVNIALANEFSDICTELGIPVMDVIDAADTKPFGFMRFLPGPGVGGHCIPCDPHYLLWQLRRSRTTAPVIEQAMHGIAQRPGRVVDRVRALLSDRGRGLAGARVLVVGAAYKANVEDVRESPALAIIAGLRAAGAVVAYTDPLVPTLREHGLPLDSEESPADFHADVALLHTRHPGSTVEWLDDVPLILDATYQLRGERNSIPL